MRKAAYGFIAITAFLLAGQNSTAYAQGNEVSGHYVDSSAGLQIDLPEGWSGTKFLGLATMVSPNGFDITNAPEAMMIIFTIDRIDANDNMISRMDAVTEPATTGDDRCQSLATEYVTLNGMHVFHVVQECNSDDGYSKSNAYGIFTKTKFIVVGYSAVSSAAYNKYLGEFEKSIRTLKADEPLNFRGGLVTMLGADRIYSQTVKAVGNDVSVKVESSSIVSGFQFSEAEKRISFRVEGDSGTRGAVVVPLQNVLVGPYTVTIDGKPTDDFMVIEDRTNGERIIQISYDHSVHNIAITGANVVPEFPVYMIGVLAAVVGVVALMGRTKLFGLPTS